MPRTTLKDPAFRKDRCVFEFGQSYFEVDPAVGGRIVSARVGAAELLAPANVHASNYGSTFWTSPQSDWEWPPIAAIDHAPYAVSSDVGSCTLTSSPVVGSRSAMDGVVVTKRFSPDLVREALLVEYAIWNEGSSAKRLAPWEITRVAPFGLTFFASEGEPSPVVGRALPPLTRASGCLWFRFADDVEHHAKLFADGKGWVAHVTPQNLLMVKTFPDISSEAFAPGEAEIEVYASNPSDAPEARYAEVENQGAYSTIEPGGASTWSVRWYLRKLPDRWTCNPGDAELMDFVDRLLGEDR